MSDSGSKTGPFDAHQKTEQLLCEVFRPVLSRHSTGPKRERPLYGFSFSPPSTPNGCHTIAERKRVRKEEREAASDLDYDGFTPRCLLQRTTMEQQLLVRSVTDITTADWNLMASCLSPPSRKPPLHPCTHAIKPCVRQAHDTPHTHMIPCDTCLCIACWNESQTQMCTMSCVRSINSLQCLSQGKQRRPFSCPHHVFQVQLCIFVTLI
jgi:hypothetical protein